MDASNLQWKNVFDSSTIWDYSLFLYILFRKINKHANTQTHKKMEIYIVCFSNLAFLKRHTYSRINKHLFFFPYIEGRLGFISGHHSWKIDIKQNASWGDYIMKGIPKCVIGRSEITGIIYLYKGKKKSSSGVGMAAIIKYSRGHQVEVGFFFYFQNVSWKPEIIMYLMAESV